MKAAVDEWELEWVCVSQPDRVLLCVLNAVGDSSGESEELGEAVQDGIWSGLGEWEQVAECELENTADIVGEFEGVQVGEKDREKEMLEGEADIVNDLLT